MNTSEKDDLHTALATAFDQFIDTFSSFDDTKINRIPFEGSWTPAQVAWHIILATDGLPDGKTRPAGRAADALLPGIRSWWEDLSQKFTSPEPLRPDDTPRTKEFILSELNRVRKKDLHIVSSMDLTAICLDIELPHTGFLTRLEWLWFIEMHLKRHLSQLENMKA
jgi:hypothetical protein